MATQIDFRASIKLDFEVTLKSIQENIKDFYSDDTISVTDLTKKLSAVDCIYKNFCDYINDYIDDQILPNIDEPYEDILYLGGEHAIEKIKTVFYDWLIHNKEKYGLHMKSIYDIVENPIISQVSGYEGLPSVLNLGDGVYAGKMAGHSFLYDGIEYYSEIGIRCPFYTEQTVRIENGKEVY
jgi:hypothetical protein